MLRRDPIEDIRLLIFGVGQADGMAGVLDLEGSFALNNVY